MKTMTTSTKDVSVVPLSSTLLLLSIIASYTSSVAAATTTKQKKINRCPLRPSHNNIIRTPLILGHRGASYHIPEHTLQSYRLALELGADYIEPDLVATKDNVLVALHSIDLNITTNVHTFNNGQYQYRARYTTVNNNKQQQFGYYVNDFTYDEIQQFTVIQRIHNTGTRYTGYDNLFKIPSFTQIVNLLHDWNTRVLPLIGRPNKVGGVTGMYVELKQSYYFEQQQYDDTNNSSISLPDLFLDELANHPLASELLFDHVTLCDDLHYDEYRVPPLVVQAFEGQVLEYLRKKFKERWMDFVKEDAILEAGVVNMEEEGNDEDDEIDEIDHRE